MLQGALSHAVHIEEKGWGEEAIRNVLDDSNVRAEHINWASILAHNLSQFSSLYMWTHTREVRLIVSVQLLTLGWCHGAILLSLVYGLCIYSL